MMVKTWGAQEVVTSLKQLVSTSKQILGRKGRQRKPIGNEARRAWSRLKSYRGEKRLYNSEKGAAVLNKGKLHRWEKRDVKIFYS